MLATRNDAVVAATPATGPDDDAEVYEGLDVVVVLALVVVVVGCVVLVHPLPTRCSGWGCTPAPARTPGLCHEHRHDPGSAIATKKSRVHW